MRFTKMNGIGNDYIYTNSIPIDVDAAFIRKVCDRHFGIGGDGVVILSNSRVADVKMTIRNADGSFAELCGNALRCVARLLWDVNRNKRTFTIETDAGIKTCRSDADGNVTVNMGKAQVETFLRTSYGPSGYLVNVGNPHFVVVCKNDASRDEAFCEYAAVLSEDVLCFPKRINVEFVTFPETNEANVRVYERGSGETLACGTGATAVYAVGKLVGTIDGKANIRLAGGTLIIDRNEKDELTVTGNAEICYYGITYGDEYGKNQ